MDPRLDEGSRSGDPDGAASVRVLQRLNSLEPLTRSRYGSVNSSRRILGVGISGQVRLTRVPEPDPTVQLDVIVRTMPGRLALLSEALDSLAALPSPSVRALIVVDTRDSDYLPEVIRLTTKLEGQIGSVVIPAPEGDTRGMRLNRGLEVASAEFVSVLDDDDIYLPTFGTQLVPHLIDHPEFGLAYGIGQRVYGEVTPDGYKAHHRGEYFAFPFDLARLAAENYIPISTFVVRRSLLAQRGLRFDAALDGMEDWTFLLDLAAECDFGFLPVPVAEWRQWRRSATESERQRRRDAHDQTVATRYGRVIGVPIHSLASIYRRREEAERRADAAEHLVAALLASRSWRWTRALRRVVGSRLPEKPGVGASGRRP